MKLPDTDNSIKNWSLTAVVLLDLLNYPHTGTCITDLGESILYVSENSPLAEAELARYLDGHGTPISDAIASHWREVCGACGLLEATMLAHCATAVRAEHKARQGAIEEWFTPGLATD